MRARSPVAIARGVSYTAPRLIPSVAACRGLSRHGERMRPVPGAQQAGLAKRAFQKIVLERELANLRVERRHIDGGLDGAAVKDAVCTGEQLLLPRGDLAGMDVEPFGQLGERGFLSHRRQGDFRLEGRGMVTTWAFLHRKLLGRREHVVGEARASTQPPCSESRDHFNSMVKWLEDAPLTLDGASTR